MQGIDQSELVRYAQLGSDINGGLTSRIYEVTDSRTGERIAGILAKKSTIGEPAGESVKRLKQFREVEIPCLEIAIADEEKNILYMSDLREEGYSLIDDTFDMHKVMSLANSDDVLIGFSTDLGKIHNLGYTVDIVPATRDEIHPTKTLWIVRRKIQTNQGQRVLTDVANLLYFPSFLEGNEEGAGGKLYQDWENILDGLSVRTSMQRQMFDAYISQVNNFGLKDYIAKHR